MNLQFKTGIAGAVAREIERGGPDGIAYKAAWDRLGSDAMKHCRAFANDCEMMEGNMSYRAVLARGALHSGARRYA